MEFLTRQNIVRIPADRVKGLILTIKTILSQAQISARTLLSLLGKLNAAGDFILLGRLHLRSLQMCLLSVWKPHILPLDHQVTINSIIKFHLKRWMNTKRFVQGMPIHSLDPKIFLYADAGHFDWVAHLEPMSILSWSMVERPIPAPYQHVIIAKRFAVLFSLDLDVMPTSNLSAN